MQIRKLVVLGIAILLTGCVVPPGSIPYPSYTVTTPSYATPGYAYQPNSYRAPSNSYPSAASPYSIYSPEGAPADAGPSSGTR
jgi:hypothetical protein